MSEETKSCQIEVYEFPDGRKTYNFLGMKNTEDYCGIDFGDLLQHLWETFEGNGGNK